MTGNSNSDTLTTTETTFNVVDTLKQLDTATISELAREMEKSKSTIHAHISTLEANNYVKKDDGGNYRLGLAFFDLGEHARNNVPLYQAGVSVIDELASRTSEKAQIMVEEHGRGYYVYRAYGENAVQTRVGRLAELHCTAAGKAALAHLPDEVIERTIETWGLPQRTAHTITTPESLYDELQTIRERGVAFNDEERLDGLRAVGAPILDDEDKLLGSVSVSGPTTRIDDNRFRNEIPDIIRQSANVINLRSRYQ